MATVFSSTYAQASLAAGVATLDAGASAPVVEILTSGDVLLISFTLDATTAMGTPTTACPSVSTGTGLPISATAVATGTAANAQIKDGNGTAQITTDSVGTSGTAVVLSSTSITSGQSFNLTALTISQPCS